VTEPRIRFDDGAAYERMMGTWSRIAGAEFLDWLAASPDHRWLDVGCGNGAFTELVTERCAPASVDGIDPSDGQLAYARTRPAARTARFHRGDAMSLPFPDGAFDVVASALVIHFIPDPAKGMAEMVRVAAPGGTVTAYTWDMPGDGFPLDAMQQELRALGATLPRPPSDAASAHDALHDLWRRAGLDAVDQREIVVDRTFDDFDDYWTTSRKASIVASALAAMSPADVARLEARMRVRLRADARGRITCSARANAIRGRVPMR
jgi:ubiquinone/menaquinone biosynthesis C-methylase UbiE